MKRIFNGLFRFVASVVIVFLITIKVAEKVFHVRAEAPILYLGLGLGVLMGVYVFIRAIKGIEDAN
jgi:hypothetical protein